ncbi:MAG TPA: PadR family transcriptional regulator [Candidatus Lokiarchaeia archaeon]|nr:PadR family transcriptional regulator [Candidatus Lokiarchaeia archaeon]
MWPQGSTILRSLSENLHHFLLLNTIKQHEGGLAFSDMKGMHAGNPSFLYREMRKLTDEGFLVTQIDQHEREGGRPKQLFTLTDAGFQKLEELQDSLRGIFEGIQTRFPLGEHDINVGEFLEKGTFQDLLNPIDYFLQKNLPVEEKLRILGEMEKGIQMQLSKVQNAIHQLAEQENSTQENETNSNGGNAN